MIFRVMLLKDCARTPEREGDIAASTPAEAARVFGMKLPYWMPGRLIVIERPAGNRLALYMMGKCMSLDKIA